MTENADARPANFSKLAKVRARARTRTVSPEAGSSEAEPVETVTTPLLQKLPRFALSLRTGFGVPWGGYADSRATEGFEESVHKISSDTHGLVPLGLDFGYWLTPSLMLGAYAMVAGAVPKQAKPEAPLEGGCPSGIECEAFGARVGLQLQYYFRPDAALRPWLGWAVGYEWMEVTLQGDGLGFLVDWEHSYAGPQWLQLQAGLEQRWGALARVGPFMDVSAMQYSQCSANLGGPDLKCDIEKPAWHGWLLIGLRGSLHL